MRRHWARVATGHPPSFSGARGRLEPARLPTWSSRRTGRSSSFSPMSRVRPACGRVIWPACARRARHDAIVWSAVSSRRGYVFSTAGDSFAIAFWTAVDAAEAAIEIQRRLSWALAGTDDRLQFRATIHAGIAEERGGDYFGAAVNRTARLMAAARGGQIVVSDAVQALLAGTAEFDGRTVGCCQVLPGDVCAGRVHAESGWWRRVPPRIGEFRDGFAAALGRSVPTPCSPSSSNRSVWVQVIPIPASRAVTIAWARFSTPSLVKMFET